MKVVTIDLKKYKLRKDLAKERLEGSSKIHMVDPNTVETRHCYR